MADASEMQKERERLEARNRQIDDMFLSLYTDKAKGVISEQRFVKLTAAMEQEPNIRSPEAYRCHLISDSNDKKKAKNMNKYKLALLLIIPLLCCTSCEEWLKVDSEDRIMEDALYSNENGFRTALNGIYIDLLNSSLYGQTLTTTTFDVLAHYYDTSKPLNTHAYVLLANYDQPKAESSPPFHDTPRQGYRE